MKWKVHHDGKVREWDEATVLSKLDKCDLTGIELAKPPGAETWAPLHSTALYQQAEDQVLLEAPILPIHVYRHRVAVSEDVEGFVLRPDGGVDLSAVRVDRS